MIISRKGVLEQLTREALLLLEEARISAFFP